ncbi:MAG: hypothetical protein ACLSTO_07985 [Bilophila wadsworthia]
MATDFCEANSLEAPVLSEATQEKLRAYSSRIAPSEPRRPRGYAEGDMWVFDRCLEVLLDDPDVDGIVIVGLYGGYADLSEEFRVLEMDVARAWPSASGRATSPLSCTPSTSPSSPTA